MCTVRSAHEAESAARGRESSVRRPPMEILRLLSLRHQVLFEALLRTVFYETHASPGVDGAVSRVVGFGLIDL